MNFFTYNNLSISTQAVGLFWTVFLFAFCFFGIHLLKLAQVGWAQYKKNPPPPQEEKKVEKVEKKSETPTTQAEPVYYIVERKQRRAKSAYGEPKRISFK